MRTFIRSFSRGIPRGDGEKGAWMAALRSKPAKTGHPNGQNRPSDERYKPRIYFGLKIACVYLRIPNIMRICERAIQGISIGSYHPSGARLARPTDHCLERWAEPRRAHPTFAARAFRNARIPASYP